MKNLLKTALLLVLVVLTSCSKEENSNPFVGTWEVVGDKFITCQNPNDYDDNSFIIYDSPNGFVYTVKELSNKTETIKISDNGTYSIDFNGEYVLHGKYKFDDDSKICNEKGTKPIVIILYPDDFSKVHNYGGLSGMMFFVENGNTYMSMHQGFDYYHIDEYYEEIYTNLMDYDYIADNTVKVRKK